MTNDNRYRNWVMLVYPESAPENWKSILDSYTVPWVCSPLHDSDLWTEMDEQECPDHRAGNPKKPHWHVALKFSGKVGLARVKRIADSINAPHPKPLNDWRAMMRYFVHLDNPDKHQYPRDGIECHGGADVGDAFDISRDEEDKILRRIMGEILDLHVGEYCILVSQYRDDDTALKVIMKHTYHLQGLIKSVRHFDREHGGRNGNSEETRSDHKGDEGESGTGSRTQTGDCSDV